MKVIKYDLCVQVNAGTSAEPVYEDRFYEVTIPYSDENIARAERNAYHGAYTVEETEDLPAALTVEERVAALEQKITVPEYTAGTWYYRGDKVSFDGSVYTCIAPQGVVCVWSPKDHAAYWQ